nr:hypothetical protein CFP56_55271 [Quercus suber]
MEKYATQNSCTATCSSEPIQCVQDDLSFLKTLAVGSSADMIKKLRMESASDYLWVAMFRLRNADWLAKTTSILHFGIEMKPL